jgi:anaerobic magnesium-protoporphyrin IX monomethyl ester cyclase
MAMRLSMVCLEDGITSCGFRKIAAFAARLNPDTRACYVSTNQFRSLPNMLKGTLGTPGELSDEGVDEIASHLATSDLVGLSSMTGYAELTKRVIARTRELNPAAYIVWGGIHPIIHPEDAVLADVDAVCTGEGEFAFEELFARLQEDRDPTGVRNFWFRRGGEVVRNDFLPLMTPADMDTLPFPQYGRGTEEIYEPGRGFLPLTEDHYLDNFSLNYQTVWSIGCPFHCSFCGNTKFIANDVNYKKVRHPSARYIVDEIRSVRERFPFVSQINFHDDSFMAIPYRELEQFAELWRAEVDVPFTVYGVIPNYVKQEKFELLTWAGMNRVRMGIQSGSQRILDFYKRPTPPERILEAGNVIASFRDYHVPPAYDVIVDNPIETRQDVVDTLELLYAMDRPYTLFIYSLKVIPNTELERAIAEHGVDLDGISSSYMVIAPRAANLLLYVLALWRPPRWLFDRLLRRVESSAMPQRLYPRIGMVLRTGYLARRAVDHVRAMDFSVLPGRTARLLWRTGVVGLCQRRFRPRLPRPDRRSVPRAETAARIPVVQLD